MHFEVSFEIQKCTVTPVKTDIVKGAQTGEMKIFTLRHPQPDNVHKHSEQKHSVTCVASQRCHKYALTQTWSHPFSHTIANKEVWWDNCELLQPGFQIASLTVQLAHMACWLQQEPTCGATVDLGLTLVHCPQTDLPFPCQITHMLPGNSLSLVLFLLLL